MSDSHTNFDAGTFTAGAATGALTVAGAMVSALQNPAQLNARRWETWERNELETAMNLSELLRAAQYDELCEERAENARLRLALRRVAMRRAA